MTTVHNAQLFVSDMIMEAIKERNIQKERYFRGVKAGIKWMLGEKEKINSDEWSG